MQAIRCDRCGKYDRRGLNYLSKQARYYNDRQDCDFPPDFDLCWKCAGELCEWLTTLHKEASADFEEMF